MIRNRSGTLYFNVYCIVWISFWVLSHMYLIISCTGGSYGTIRVKARTIGGGESWQASLVGQVSNTSNTINEALANSQGQKSAEVDADYQLLEEELILNVSTWWKPVLAIDWSANQLTYEQFVSCAESPKVFLVELSVDLFGGGKYILSLFCLFYLSLFISNKLTCCRHTDTVCINVC